jgi:signal transduction histidine kinase
MEAIRTLTGGIAHNFNNILGIIMGNMELALDDVPGWNPAHFNLEEIKTASLRAKDIVRQLLGFARTTASVRKPIKLIAVIKDSLKYLRTTIPTSIDILQKMDHTADTVLADPTQIHQVMINLGTNAAQAMQETGGILKIEIQNVVLDKKSAALYPDLKMGNYLQMAVSDTGPGIVPEIRNRIFDPYFTTKEVGKGTGMGLAVVYGIVKSHGGAISVDSKVGKGTTFNILFPVALKEAVTTSEIAKA